MGRFFRSLGAALRIAFHLLLRLRFMFKWVLLVWIMVVVLLGALILIYGRIDRAEEADVIVVLGAGLRRDGRPGPALIRRSEKAAELWAEGYAANIICAGGFPLGMTRSEADACAEVLRNSGVPAGSIYLEDRSRSTEENALYTRELMDAKGWTSAVIVSDGYHLLRATWIFSGVGIEHTTSPAADPTRRAYLTAFVRELAAFHWQALKGVLNLPFTYVPVL